MNRELRKLNLPSALEALERPIGLPPSLLQKAEEVRLEDGPVKIEASIEDVQTLAHQDMNILDEVRIRHCSFTTILPELRTGPGHIGQRGFRRRSCEERFGPQSSQVTRSKCGAHRESQQI